MADGRRDRRKRGGRVTPPSTAAKPERRSGPSRSVLPSRIGPFARPDPNAPLGQVGRRPSSPITLLVIGLAWIACGVVALVGLHTGWRIVPGVVFIGIGLLFARGGLTVIARQGRR